MPPRLLFALSALCLTLSLALAGCSGPPPATRSGDPIGELIGGQGGPALAPMGYATQVGAFSELDNAVRLERRLDRLGIEAYYFRDASGLYKVRFGNHESYDAARGEAERLRARRLIGDYFIVIPESYAAARIGPSGNGDLREELVATARRFIGVPYRWGGTDSQQGFDCSGLTMVSYRLNGLDLPRVSRSQFRAGRYVARSKLRKGDLVFFATKGGTRVTHVGMYAGNGTFIHAPRTGQKVRVESLANPFFARTYVGGRTYL